MSWAAADPNRDVVFVVVDSGGIVHAGDELALSKVWSELVACVSDGHDGGRGVGGWTPRPERVVTAVDRGYLVVGEADERACFSIVSGENDCPCAFVWRK